MLDCKNFCLSALDVQYAGALARMEALHFDHAWDEQQFARLLGQDHFLCCGALAYKQLHAYACGYIVAGELEIVNVAVELSFRKQGLGTRLVHFLLDRSLLLGMSRAVLEVRQSNVAALSLYARCGFVPMGVRPGYYQDTGEDALTLEWRKQF